MSKKWHRCENKFLQWSVNRVRHHALCSRLVFFGPVNVRALKVFFTFISLFDNTPCVIFAWRTP